MCGLIHNNFVARTAEDAHGDLVAHGACGKENGVLLAGQLADHFGEEVDRGVFLFLLVADFGFADKAAHVRGGAGCSVAVKIDTDFFHFKRLVFVRLISS